MLHFLAGSIRHSSARWHVALALLFAAALAVELFGMHAFKTIENRLADVFMERHAADYSPDPDIAVVDIDDVSLAAMEQTAGLWPWPREIHADLLAALAEFAPRAVVFDIGFAERDRNRPKSDALLSDAIAAMPRAYLPAVRLDAKHDQAGALLRELPRAFGVAVNGLQDARAALQLPLVVDRKAWRLGLINTADENDGVLRRYRLHAEVQGWRLPSLPARVAADLGAALPAGSDFLMRWPAASHRHFSYGELFMQLTEKRAALDADALRLLHAALDNKIILIGASAASSFDHHLTPLGAGFPGVNVMAVAIDNLKNGRHVRIVQPAVPFGFGLVLIVLLSFMSARRINPMAIGIALAAVSVATLAIADAVLDRDLLLTMATPLIFAWVLFLSTAIVGYLRERRARNQAVSLFGRFLNPNVVRQIVEQGETVESLSGRTCNISVLFSDIRGFTTLSESRSPNEVVDLLNRHFERQVEVVFRHGGTLDKFIGDCIMAFWGAPLDDPDHAKHAVAAAMEMQEALLEFKAELAAEGSNVGDFDVGIGVHSGPAVVGFIGARRKLDYTAIGDTVNLSSRVEGLTKGVARVLVTSDTMRACSASDHFDFEPRGAFTVKGRAAEVELFEPKRKTP